LTSLPLTNSPLSPSGGLAAGLPASGSVRRPAADCIRSGVFFIHPDRLRLSLLLALPAAAVFLALLIPLGCLQVFRNPGGIRIGSGVLLMIVLKKRPGFLPRRFDLLHFDFLFFRFRFRLQLIHDAFFYKTVY
jgi:hypothetical protein